MLAEKKPSMEIRLAEDLDDFELFCLLAGHRRRLDSCEYGGSLPCIPPPKSESRDGELKNNFLEVQAGSGVGYLSVPSTPHMRRAHSDSGDRHPSGLSNLARPTTNNNNSPGLKTSRKTPGKKSKPLKLWSSIRSLVSSCDSSPMCLSPTSPTLLTTPAAKCPSAPPSRVASVKRRVKQKVQETGDCLTGMMRPRTSSMPTKNDLRRPQCLSMDAPDTYTGHMEDWRRVRNFVTTPKKIINCGDSFRSKSTSSIRSLGSCGSGVGEEGHESGTSMGSQEHVPLHSVLIMGAAGVGKTTLAQQFLTSECLVEADEYADFDESTRVSVLLNEEEATIELREVACGEDGHQNRPVDAYVVVFSTIDRGSFQHAVELLGTVRKQWGSNTTLVLAANKTDLVRLRHVGEQEGKAVAETHGGKYMEVSALMNLNVDELLAGILNQIRLHQLSPVGAVVGKGHRDDCRSAMGLLGRFIKRQTTSSKSCDNLLVL